MIYQNPTAPWAEVKYQRVFDLNVTSQNQKSSCHTVRKVPTKMTSLHVRVGQRWEVGPSIASGKVSNM